MNDQYDIYCFNKLRERLANTLNATQQADDVACACANYLASEGYETAITELTRKRAKA